MKKPLLHKELKIFRAIFVLTFLLLRTVAGRKDKPLRLLCSSCKSYVCKVLYGVPYSFLKYKEGVEHCTDLSKIVNVQLEDENLKSVKDVHINSTARRGLNKLSDVSNVKTTV